MKHNDRRSNSKLRHACGLGAIDAHTSGCGRHTHYLLAKTKGIVHPDMCASRRFAVLD
jgi:hypothetical protein